eukprot:TRINITY_DN23293_c0_g1_i3.p2 TRINITY_DN23293_c0_g1~~TRINITY_DN23293_c0_g1_i3.p2  ORF type:complete len:135 (+),score=30.47 TRINITY_DN23293_c0_g1_i3:2-406(+)
MLLCGSGYLDKLQCHRFATGFRIVRIWVVVHRRQLNKRGEDACQSGFVAARDTPKVSMEKAKADVGKAVLDIEAKEERQAAAAQDVKMAESPETPAQARQQRLLNGRGDGARTRARARTHQQSSSSPRRPPAAW